MALQKRPPIVVVVGHVDHGKTSLLDYIRKANVATREAGGITQSIGAYEIKWKERKITFIDTPGHEAFMAMRARGARIADIAILVVAADDSVQNQTKETIKILKETETPFVVAITKIDRQPDTQQVKNDLMQVEVLLEGFGGDVSWQEVSAKTGEGVNELLDILLLTADVENVEYDPTRPAQGYIIESRKDSRRGVIVNAVIIDGTVKAGDEVAVGSVGAKIRSLENFLGKRVETAEPSMPVTIIGFKEVPTVGEKFVVGKPTESTQAQKTTQKQIVRENGVAAIDVVLKADTAGSLEALSQIIKNVLVPPEFILRIVDEGIGEITDGDVQWLFGTGDGMRLVIGFNVEATSGAENLAKSNHVTILTSCIIYELVQKLEEKVKMAGKEVVIGDLEILAVFGKKGGGQQIIGGKVAAGEIRNNSACGIQRNGDVMGPGRILNLQQAKKDAAVVVAGNECGLLVQSDVEIRVGDHIIIT